MLRERGLPGRVVELSDSTRSAAEAARAVGCDLRQIVKSLVFQGADSKSPILVLASGANRVDEPWMTRYAGEPLARADPEFVRGSTGFAIGGVPPTGHPSRIPTFVDYDLLELPELWAAAGHPHAVCRLNPTELLELTHARPVPVAPLTPSEPDGPPWVTFDCYGTLIDWRTGILQQLDRLAPARSPDEAARRFRDYVREEMTAERRPYRPYRTVMADAILALARAEALELTRSDAEAVPESIPDWPAFPDTREALLDLQRHGFRIGILSNIESDLLARTLDRLGVSVDAVVTAEEVGAYKPAWNHWIRFLKRTGVDPGSVRHVSASYEHDIAPATALGFRTVYVERYGPPPTGVPVGTTVKDLRRLVDRFPRDPAG